MSFTDATHDRLRSAVLASLPCQAAPVQLALGALLSAAYEPRHTLIACAFDEGEPCLHVGAALDLVHIGLQRLHAQLDDPESDAALLGNAGNVLAGDYLTSGSFKMLLHCKDMRVLQLVADAITRTCELECEAHGQPRGPALARPLGEVAGLAGALLAGHDAAAQDLARRFGAALASDDAEGALQAAQALQQATGNSRPLALAQRLAAAATT